MMIRPGLGRWNSRVGFLAFLEIDAAYGGSRELLITYFSYYLSSEDNRRSKTRGTPEKGIGQAVDLFAQER